MGRRGRRALVVFGAVLIAGGLGHLGGVGLHFLERGVPGPGRVLLDLWIGVAHVAGGVAYVLAGRAAGRGGPWRPPASIGAFVVLAYTLPFLPVLYTRAGALFRIFPTLYAVASVAIVVALIRSRRAPRGEGVSAV